MNAAGLAGPPPGSGSVPTAFSAEPVRTLHAVRVPEGRVHDWNGESNVIAVLDTETSGFDPNDDVIVELAIRRIRIDGVGRIVEIGQGRSWLEDPGRPLDPEVARLTGIADADLAGRWIDERVAASMLRSADWVCAHNSRFDRPFVERRLPAAAGAKWCCSCVDVDWSARGLEGRGLGWLLSQSGLCHAGHRALNDVDAVVALLAAESGGRTAAAEMVENAAAPAWLVGAVGASFSVKDALRRRGYRWNAGVRTWQREVPDRDLQTEEFWLARTVYSAGANPQALAPRIEPVNPATRFL